MTQVSTPATWKRWAIRAAVLSVAVLIVVSVAVWLAFQYIPTWYDPPQLSRDDLPEVRASLSAAFQEFSDRLVGGGTFEFKLPARTVNKWIAGRGSIWPEARDILPGWLREPVVAFEGDRIIAAARFERNGWRAIVSAHLAVTVEGEEVLVRLVKTAVGAMGAPLDPVLEALEGWIGQLLEETDETPEYLWDLMEAINDPEASRLVSDGIGVENRFIWPNGERYFRLVDVRTDDGWLVLTIEAL